MYGLQFRIDTLARVLERDVLWVADACDQLLREQLWLVASRARIKALRPRDRIPSVTLSSDKSSTIASRRPLARSFTAR